jgi:hypothetical protein
LKNKEGSPSSQMILPARSPFKKQEKDLQNLVGAFDDGYPYDEDL